MTTLKWDREVNTSYEGHPRFEGCNIGTWMGFKHIMYLMEEAVLDYFRKQGLDSRYLYQEHGLQLEIVDSSVRILHALNSDDKVTVTVQPAKNQAPGEITLATQLLVTTREGASYKAVSGKVAVLFRKADNASDAQTPEQLAPYTHPAVLRAQTETPELISSSEEAITQALVPPGTNTFLWKWRIPYFYCHFSEHLQHSGYLRIMEEIVDLFLAERNISIRKMLHTRSWIPAVPTAQMEILQEVFMEETLYSVYTVEEVFKDLTYTSRLDCYVIRDNKLIHTATGRITHSYMELLGRTDKVMAHFDEETLCALRGEQHAELRNLRGE